MPYLVVAETLLSKTLSPSKEPKPKMRVSTSSPSSICASYLPERDLEKEYQKKARVHGHQRHTDADAAVREA